MMKTNQKTYASAIAANNAAAAAKRLVSKGFDASVGSVDDVREAMSIDPLIPIVSCDARNRESTKQTLITLVEHAMRQWMSVRAG